MADLTRTALVLLDLLRFRRSLGQSWLVQEPRQRYSLVVPTMLTSRRLERLRSVNASTLRQLHTASLIKYGPDVEVPRFGYLTEWQRGQLRVNGKLTGCTITLTEKGLR